MNPVRGRVLPVLFAATLLVGGANLAAYAANGHPLLLGHSNSESKTATVTKSGSGPALKLKTRASSPPLAVTSKKVVKNLNADTVDGSSASALKTTSRILTDTDTTTVHSGLATWSLAGVPAGRYLVSWDVNLQPLTTNDGAVCAITTTDFSRQFAAAENVDPGGWVAFWLSGSTVMKVDPSTQEFFCQTHGSNIHLKNPLTISFTKIDRASGTAISPSRNGAPSSRAGVTR